MAKLLHARTAAQTLIVSGISTYLPPGSQLLVQSTVDRGTWYRKVRRMRHDATIAFLRDVYMAPIIAADWSVEVKHPRFADAVETVEGSFIPKKRQFLRDALRGLLDYGWQSFEVVRKQLDDASLKVVKLKSLLADITQIVVDEHGNMLGVMNTPFWTHTYHEPTRLYRGDCICLYRDAEGTNWYGDPIMKRAEVPYDSWNESEASARRFDNKVAGSFLVITYPKGTTALNGVETANEHIANVLAKTAQASGTMTIPLEVQRFTDDLNNVTSDKNQWKIELMSPQSQQGTFVDRAKYIDSTKCRAFGIPERAVTEGQFGTKAEAGEHADFAIDNMEMTSQDIVEQVNEQGVDPLLELNHGPEYVGNVFLRAEPINDDLKALLKQIYMTRFQNETGQVEENDKLKWESIRERLGLPVRDHVEDRETPELKEGEAGDNGLHTGDDGPDKRGVRSRSDVALQVLKGRKARHPRLTAARQGAEHRGARTNGRPI